MTVVLFHAVKPDPVTAVKVTNLLSSSADISWSLPVEADDKELLCQITCTSLQGYVSDQVCQLGCFALICCVEFLSTMGDFNFRLDPSFKL